MYTMDKIFELKLTGDVHQDIDKVYDAIGYTESLIEGLVKEWQAQKLGIDTEYTELLDAKDALNTASHSIFKVRNWREPKRVYGPLAREDMPF